VLVKVNAVFKETHNEALEKVRREGKADNQAHVVAWHPTEVEWECCCLIATPLLEIN
jgi:hypothetical protein